MGQSNESLLEFIKKFRVEPRNQALVCHPDLKPLIESSEPYVSEMGEKIPLLGNISLLGFRVFYSSSIEPTWIPPKDPYIEYEEKDHHWLKTLGYGTWVPGCYLLDLPVSRTMEFPVSEPPSVKFGSYPKHLLRNSAW